MAAHRLRCLAMMKLLPATARDKDAISGIETSAERNIQAGNKCPRYLNTKYIKIQQSIQKSDAARICSDNAGRSSLAVLEQVKKERPHWEYQLTRSHWRLPTMSAPAGSPAE